MNVVSAEELWLEAGLKMAGPRPPEAMLDENRGRCDHGVSLAGV